MADLHQKLASLQGLLPSQRQWLDRLIFQLEFNPYQHIRVVGGAGTGKSTMALAIADLLSEDFNLALLTASEAFTPAQIRQHLLDNWFGFGGDGHKRLIQLVGERQSAQPLGLVIDQADDLPDELWCELAELPCLIIALGEHHDPHAELNLPLASASLDDARVLLKDQDFGTLTLADRLDRANGNLHFLLDPQLAKAPVKKAKQVQPSGISPLAVFITGMALIGGVVIFWMWTEKQQAAAGLGQLTYLPEEQQAVASAPAPAMVKPQPSKQEIDALVNKLEKADPAAGSASKLERPAEFDFGKDAPSAPTTAAVTPEPQVAQPAVTQPQAIQPQTTPAEPTPAEPIAVKTATPAVANEQLMDPLKDQPVASKTPDISAATAEPANDATTELAAETEVKPVLVKPNPTDVADELASEAGGVETPVAAETEPVPAKASSNFNFQEADLLAMSGSQVALQLVVFSNETALKSFQQSYASLQTFVYERRKNGQRQLVVVLAPFGDSAKAKARISTLPSALQQGFVKSIADIQAEINQQ